MFNDKIKKIIGQELHKYRCDRFLQLKTVAAKTGIPWYVIDNMEIGSVRKWEHYRHLLEFYGRNVKIELVGRTENVGNGTAKNNGGNNRRETAERPGSPKNNVKGKNKKGKAKCFPFFMAAAEFFRCKQAFAFDLPIAKYSAAGCFRTSDDL